MAFQHPEYMPTLKVEHGFEIEKLETSQEPS
jgi:hypothetical protein